MSIRNYFFKLWYYSILLKLYIECGIILYGFFLAGCRYSNGTHYLMERYHLAHPPYDDDLRFWMNFGLNFLFTGAMFFANIILHIVPLPAFVKSKFRG